MTTETTLKESKHIAHDYPLVKSLLLSFIAVLVTGLALNKFVDIFVETHLPLESAEDPTWKHFEWHGDIELSRRPIPGTKLYAYQAATAVDLPLRGVMKVFRDTPNHVKWVKDLVESEEWHKSAHHKGEKQYIETEILRQRYNVPIPGIKDREFLMQKTLTTEEASDGSGRTSVSAEFISFEDDNEYPVCDRCVRGRNLGSKWTFTALEGGERTMIVADIAIDPAVTTLSPFFVNNFLKRWPHVTMNRMLKICNNNAGKEEKVTAHKVLQGLFPIKH